MTDARALRGPLGELHEPAGQAEASEVASLQHRWGNQRLVQLRRALQRRAAGPVPDWMRSQLGMTEPCSAPADELALPAGGRALPAPIQRQAEAQLGTDLSGVSVAYGADQACDPIGAQAFTTPNDGGGHLVALSSAVDLASEDGQFTLLHELAHVAQQQRGTTAGLDGLGGDEQVRTQLEDEADALAARSLRQPGPTGGRHG